MSHKHQAEGLGDADDDEPSSKDPGPPRSRQPNGSSAERRSWRPCQTQSPDGEPGLPHHHHHHHQHPPQHHPAPSARGPPRQRRRPTSGTGPAQGQGRPAEGMVPDAEPQPVSHPRPGVSRYRRMGDPNPRLRGPRQRPPGGEATPQQRPPPPHGPQSEGPSGPAQRASQHGEGPDQALPTQAGSDPPAREDPLPRPRTDSPVVEEDAGEGQPGGEEGEEAGEAEEAEGTDGQEGVNGDGRAAAVAAVAGRHGYVHDHTQAFEDWREDPALEEEEREEEDEGVRRGGAEESLAPESEANDLCSDTESAASLSMEGHLHSPPPLHSPTPPSSPVASPFPHLDRYDEDAGLSPGTPDQDPLPDPDEDGSVHSVSYAYPKTYADFYSESHSKSCPQPLSETHPEPYTKSYPDSFPEALVTPYPELGREPHRRRGGRRESWDEDEEESYRESSPERRGGPEDVQKGDPASPSGRGSPQPRLSRDLSSFQSHACQSRSVGSRLHHYDGQSDGEGDSTDGSLSSRSAAAERGTPRGGKDAAQDGGAAVPAPACQGDASRSNEQAGPGEDPGKGSGDAISMAIKDIKEAIEEVKTKTVRSPYTPDQPVEPIWVMRQDVSPTEEGYQTTGGCHAGSMSESPDHYGSAVLRDPGSPVGPESSRGSHHHHHQHHHHQQQQQQQHYHQHHPQSLAQQPQLRDREGARQTQPYVQPQPYPPPVLPNQQQRPAPANQPPAGQPPPPSLAQHPSVQEMRRPLHSFPTFVEVPGPCDPEDLIDGIIFAASYLGSTHLLSERTPSKSARMQQAQEAMHRVRAAQKQAKNRKKSTEAETPSTGEVDLFMSTQRIKVLNADTQEAMMDLPLRTISYIADIGNMVVLMARGKMVRSRSATQEPLEPSGEQETLSGDDRRLYRMICHVFESEDAQLIAQSIGQSFSVAYQEFLRANGIDPEDLSQREYSDLLNTQDMYNDDLIHFSKSENCKDVYIEKQKGEMLGLVIVESGWGSILPTVIIASMMHAGPAEKSGRLNIGDQIMTINGTSLVGLPLNTCQSIIKGLKSQSRIKMNIVRCPPVTMVLIRRPDLRYQLGFSVQNGIICSLMRGGIAERGGVRVGHRIIEINSQSVVATPHEKIVQILSNAMGEIHMKTMPAAMYRLLTAQEQPVYI
ncbi:amyloid-beta A4 precursor protein-binding family A member 1 isoform X1 [Gadus morhua]|uniref:Amyloid beta (A4) precursor protein-binding, family A, member 1b n=1 Tax=Gadus morhua TaxID=8049 RepID=A0A8C5ANU8_GADMO|nr:amyloid-beta A4 precursor protein-binding family A member 1-like isoform X1 [Gadus morhua]